MKNVIFILLLALGSAAIAQNVDIKDATGTANGNANEEGETLIQIKKSKGGQPIQSTAQPLWQVVDGNADVEGEPSAIKNDARKSWQKACEDWKKEFRADNNNKESKVLSANCGSATCSGDVGQIQCTSKAVYKLKTKMN